MTNKTPKSNYKGVYRENKGKTVLRQRQDKNTGAVRYDRHEKKMGPFHDHEFATVHPNGRVTEGVKIDSLSRRFNHKAPSHGRKPASTKLGKELANTFSTGSKAAKPITKPVGKVKPQFNKAKPTAKPQFGKATAAGKASGSFTKAATNTTKPAKPAFTRAASKPSTPTAKVNTPKPTSVKSSVTKTTAPSVTPKFNAASKPSGSKIR